MDQIIQHLTESHQFYLAVVNSLVPLVTTLVLGFSNPPGSGKKNGDTDK
jgi:hypothetical protein